MKAGPWVALTFVSLVLFFLACGAADERDIDDQLSHVDGDADGDTDGDADVDVDAGGDVDGDTDVDGDGDADGDSDTDGDGDSDSDTDGDSDNDLDAGTDSSHDADGDGQVTGDGGPDADTERGSCPDWPCDQTSFDSPMLRVTALNFTAPPTLGTPLIQALLDTSLDDFSLMWLLVVDFDSAIVRSGMGLAESIPPETVTEFCNVSWNTEYEQEEIPVLIGNSGLTISTASPVPAINIPVYSHGELLLDLPLLQVEIRNLTIAENRCFIGAPLEYTEQWEFASAWAPGGVLQGWISFDAAQSVVIGGLGTNLCTLLCGDDCDDDRPPGECSNPASLIPGTDEQWGFLLQADIGAGAVTIE